jgi:NhaP-type Na+/H+ or K+/H+ antiporter
MEDVALKLAAIGVAGIGAQWLAWRLKLPAIVLLLLAGFIAGPLTGFLEPSTDFGEIYKPVVGLAVAIILFEGGLTLNFKEISETSKGVRRMILIAGPLTWLGALLAAHYVGGLVWPAAIVLGAILVVTGPTVIMPLLRSAQLKQRPASMLRWEAIVNDPIGALFAVIAFEVFLATQSANGHGPAEIFLNVISAFAFAIVIGYAAGYLLSRAFIKGHIPDYLKAPVLFTTVLLLFAVSNMILEESGLLTVTVMGITLANTRIASLTEMRRFKETVTVLLVSGVFILLTAALDWETIQSLDWHALGFVLLLLFVIRPVAVTVATIGAGLTWQERLLVGWIAPRGIVAVAIAGLFGASLVGAGVEDGQRMIALTFAVVVGSILLHGFSLSPLSRILGLKTTDRPGVLLVGGSKWSTSLARRLQSMEIPVTIADANWNHLSEARLNDIPVHFGDVLSEHSHHHLALNKFSTLIAVTDNDAYNALVCTDFGPEMGRSNVFQIGAYKEKSERKALSFTLGGRQLMSPGISYNELEQKTHEGWTFQSTRITDEFTFEKFQNSRPDGTHIVLWRKPDGKLVPGKAINDHQPQPKDVILSFAMAKPEKEAVKVQTEKKLPDPKLPE